jgi:hypothetical protein
MVLVDVLWSFPVNTLIVECACGITFFWPSNYSVVRCAKCNSQMLWHSVDPKLKSGPWSLPVMEHRLWDQV